MDSGRRGSTSSTGSNAAQSRAQKRGLTMVAEKLPVGPTDNCDIVRRLSRERFYNRQYKTDRAVEVSYDNDEDENEDENDMEEENLASPVVNKIYREDFLWKRGDQGHKFSNWKKRYFVLRTNSLSYYSDIPHGLNAKKDLLKGSLFLPHTTFELVEEDIFEGKQNCIRAHVHQGKTYVFSFTSGEQRTSWMATLQNRQVSLKSAFFTVNLSGALMKKGKGNKSQSKKRWARVQRHYMLYFDKPQEHPDDYRNIKGNVDLFQSAVTTEGDDQFSICVATGRVFYFTASSVQRRDVWVDSIAKVQHQAVVAHFHQYRVLEISGKVGGKECEGSYLDRLLRISLNSIEIHDPQVQLTTLVYPLESFKGSEVNEKFVYLDFGSQETGRFKFYHPSPSGVARTIDLAIAHLKVLKTTAEKSSHAMTNVLANIRINAENKEAERLTNTDSPSPEEDSSMPEESPSPGPELPQDSEYSPASSPQPIATEQSTELLLGLNNEQPSETPHNPEDDPTNAPNNDPTNAPNNDETHAAVIAPTPSRVQSESLPRQCSTPDVPDTGPEWSAQESSSSSSEAEQVED